MSANARKRVYFFANGIYSDQISGGDIHFFHMAQAAMDAGYVVHFFGGHALEKQLHARFRDFELTLTDKSQANPFNANSFFGQFKLLFDYARRLIGSLRRISKIHPDEIAYAVSDYWFDVLPLILCRAKRKLMIWHMQAPSLKQILYKSRGDVDWPRIASFYYWLSQSFSLWLFHFMGNKHIFYVHPDMRSRLLQRGYREGEMSYLSFGIDVKQASNVPPQGKIYDAIWVGRVHRQKGIEDLLATFSYLNRNLIGFRALLVGNIKKELHSKIVACGLEGCVEFSGFVSEAEKFRLFKASRVFLISSRFEGSPRVIGEALACGIFVVAYEVETYRAIFGNLIHYVPCFKIDQFQRDVLNMVETSRSGTAIHHEATLKQFSRENSWQTVACNFLKLLEINKN